MVARFETPVPAVSTARQRGLFAISRRAVCTARLANTPRASAYALRAYGLMAGRYVSTFGLRAYAPGRTPKKRRKSP